MSSVSGKIYIYVVLANYHYYLFENKIEKINWFLLGEFSFFLQQFDDLCIISGTLHFRIDSRSSFSLLFKFLLLLDCVRLLSSRRNRSLATTRQKEWYAFHDQSSCGSGDGQASCGAVAVHTLPPNRSRRRHWFRTLLLRHFFFKKK